MAAFLNLKSRRACLRGHCFLTQCTPVSVHKGLSRGALTCAQPLLAGRDSRALHRTHVGGGHADSCLTSFATFWLRLHNIECSRGGKQPAKAESVLASNELTSAPQCLWQTHSEKKKKRERQEKSVCSFLHQSLKDNSHATASVPPLGRINAVISVL